jgi:hypothetical protein
MQSNQKSVKDMRKNERFDVTDVVRIIDKPSGRDIGQLVNISEDGIMMHGTQPIPENSIMQLALVFDCESGSTPDINIGVESLWSQTSSEDSNHWTGFFIIDISEQDQERIRNMISQA